MISQGSCILFVKRTHRLIGGFLLRLLTLRFSVMTVASFGRALAGFGGFLFGKGRIDYIVQGLALGCVCTVAAFWAWRRYLREIDAEAKKDLQD